MDKLPVAGLKFINYAPTVFRCFREQEQC